PSERPGVLRRGYRLADDTGACDLVLTDLVLEDGALLAAPGAAGELLEYAIDRATLAFTAQAVGAMQAVLAIVSAYLKTRVQFGQPIGKFQALQHRMADMFVEAQEARSILYQGMAWLDAQAPRRRHAVSCAKVVAANAGLFVAGQGIQLHGGVGVTEEFEVGQYYKRMLVFEKLFGDTDQHLARIAANADDD
ncbi:MAG: acyl-CoA dehydrogenase, partial [Gammaproteobacteria bacterium]